MKSFGHTRPLRAEDGEIIGSKLSPVRVRTVEPWGQGGSRERNKRIILTAHPGDVLGVRLEHSRQELSITARDLYWYLLRCAANRSQLEKARERKAKRAERLARQRQDRAEKRLFAKLIPEDVNEG